MTWPPALGTEVRASRTLRIPPTSRTIAAGHRGEVVAVREDYLGIECAVVRWDRERREVSYRPVCADLLGLST